MAHQAVARRQSARRYAARDELLGSLSRDRRRQSVHKRTDERNAHRAIVERGGVCTLAGPATTLVDVPVAANQEIVANVPPATRVHVIVLNVSDGERTAGGRCAGRCGRMMDDHEAGRLNGQSGAVERWLGAPVGTGDQQ